MNNDTHIAEGIGLNWRYVNVHLDSAECQHPATIVGLSNVEVGPYYLIVSCQWSNILGNL